MIDGYSNYNEIAPVFEDLEKLKSMYVELGALGENHEALAILRTIQNTRNFIAFSTAKIENDKKANKKNKEDRKRGYLSNKITNFFKYKIKNRKEENENE